jgi:hypothetical protein
MGSSVKLWDLAACRCRAADQVYAGNAFSVVFSQDGKAVPSAHNLFVTVWRFAESGREKPGRPAKTRGRNRLRLRLGDRSRDGGRKGNGSRFQASVPFPHRGAASARSGPDLVATRRRGGRGPIEGGCRSGSKL